MILPAVSLAATLYSWILPPPTKDENKNFLLTSHWWPYIIELISQSRNSCWSTPSSSLLRPLFLLFSAKKHITWYGSNSRFDQLFISLLNIIIIHITQPFLHLRLFFTIWFLYFNYFLFVFLLKFFFFLFSLYCFRIKLIEKIIRIEIDIEFFGI